MCPPQGALPASPHKGPGAVWTLHWLPDPLGTWLLYQICPQRSFCRRAWLFQRTPCTPPPQFQVDCLFQAQGTVPLKKGLSHPPQS